MATKDTVLRLLKNSTTFLSGEKIAQELQLSRTSVWKAIKELEKAGYQFEHGPIGYRYLPSDVLDATEIKQELQNDQPRLHVKTMTTSQSTMQDAKLAAAKGTDDPTLFVADMQENARGRFGRPFFAEPGRGIYMSLLLHPNQEFDELPQYTLVAASACAKAIEKLTGVSTQIKWVNDIYVNGKKICGILSEAISDMESGRISHVIIGMGINFSLPQNEFPQEIQQKATSIFPDGHALITRNQLIIEIWKELFTYLREPANKEYLSFYRKKSFVLGKQVSFTQKGTTYHGVAKSITDTGELVVQTPQELKVLSSGEISLSSIN
ncbi:biotin--[acetyl-CoA-carboxylase] ligase [Enterococcus sp. DIV0660C]|uniref:biotin--[acetyl-CoA-carboxylase] ligase n=1 Tax=Enterococcus sp. DIV0660C TaxID=2230880 RepID=UPI001A9087B7|nr:biotin--[acetyl-CoA-carboxylase] ligase [Enterococcus sp. DIV0660C]MBO0431352.1 biotin--[acetyl-CoA-carboxylase] ligase [Enterococcus sp. DIV0660C]